MTKEKIDEVAHIIHEYRNEVIDLLSEKGYLNLTTAELVAKVAYYLNNDKIFHKRFFAVPYGDYNNFDPSIVVKAVGDIAGAVGKVFQFKSDRQNAQAHISGSVAGDTANLLNATIMLEQLEAQEKRDKTIAGVVLFFLGGYLIIKKV